MSTEKRSTAPPRPAPRPVVGIVGGIGAGKSTVARSFQGLGARIVDADEIVHKLLHEKEIREEIVSRFGARMLDASGAVDRTALREVFADPGAVEDLEAILHPPVLERIREEVARHRSGAETEASRAGATEGSPPGAAPLLVLDVPLLIEKGLHSLTDALIFVDAPRAVRLARLMRRSGFDEAELDRREKLQSSINFKRDLADYRIDCSTSRESTDRQVRTIWAELTTGRP